MITLNIIKERNVNLIFNIVAHRYCEKCNIFICKDCALEYHFEHANYARLTVESCFNSKGEEINCFIDNRLIFL